MITYSGGRIYVDGSTPAKREDVWNVLTDTTLWPSWGPSVATVECEQRYIRAGSQGKVRTTVGFWLPFKVSSYEELHFWGWQVGGIEATGHRLAQDGKNCRIIFDMPWWSAPYSFICLRAIGRIIDLAEVKTLT